MIVSSSTSAEDIALLDRIARRDQAGLAELYDRHCRLLFTLILRILKDRGEAEDVLQEVFVRVWDRADGYDPSLGAPAAWLARCLLYTSDAADERSSVDLGGRRIIKK